MKTFPAELPGSKPNYIFFDNNCTLFKYLSAMQPRSPIRNYFSTIGLPVDVFHFKSKHKEDDLVCQAHCNPASFPDLITEQNTWTFNSSAAEQVNAWFVKFRALVKEMGAVRYNFFLDEMIALRNEMTAENLDKRGLQAHLVPEDDLMYAQALTWM